MYWLDKVCQQHNLYQADFVLSVTRSDASLVIPASPTHLLDTKCHPVCSWISHPDILSVLIHIRPSPSYWSWWQYWLGKWLQKIVPNMSSLPHSSYCLLLMIILGKCSFLESSLAQLTNDYMHCLKGPFYSLLSNSVCSTTQKPYQGHFFLKSNYGFRIKGLRSLSSKWIFFKANI